MMMGRFKIIDTDEEIILRKKNAIRFRLLRAAFGFTQNEVAKKSGLSFSTIAKFEKGTMRLNLHSTTLLFELFNHDGLQTIVIDERISITLEDKFISKLCESSNLKVE